MLELLKKNGIIPFSFRYQNRISTSFLEGWSEETAVNEGDTEGERFFTDPASGLRIRVAYMRYPAFSATEWKITFENTSDRETPIISDILPLDLRIPHDQGEPLIVHYSKGSSVQQDDFLPTAKPLAIDDHIVIKTKGGRSSDTALPFFLTESNGQGIIAAIGWTGQWQAVFTRDAEGLRIQGGMERTHLKLLPGETIGGPSILISTWQGTDAEVGHNQLRRFILEHKTPRLNGKIVIPPLSHMTMSTFHQTGITSEALELAALNKTADMDLEAFWVDACWYGNGTMWWYETGNWHINKEFFPNGLKVIGDAAHEKNMKLVQWFEPERIWTGTDIHKEHPEFLLKWDEDASNYLYDLGNPEAWAFLVDLISGFLKESGADIYRQDCNFEPLPYWRQNDPPDREGITEIRHIEGLYALWDELLRRFPGLAIDNCASGGRRIDLETTKRSFPLWRSDYSDVTSLQLSPGSLPIGDQSQTAGLSRWIPLHSASVWEFSPYAFRSAMSTGLCIYCSMADDAFPKEEARKALDELRRIRPFLLGDYHELVKLSLSEQEWCAYQFHRSDLQAGIAVFLRRHESPYDRVQAAFRQIDTQAEYEYGLSRAFEEPVYTHISGMELSRLQIEIPEKKGSVLLVYRKL
ncbi:alpha-galactosidase [Paenibacillus sp. GCM10027626]|uniref:alpha-galactosidase n=1 Tax=Paenibacillus sp. GCM10027626 TaxID=3273411 RepID=UPI0036415989